MVSISQRRHASDSSIAISGNMKHIIRTVFINRALIGVLIINISVIIKADAHRFRRQWRQTLRRTIWIPSYKNKSVAVYQQIGDNCLLKSERRVVEVRTLTQEIRKRRAVVAHTPVICSLVDIASHLSDAIGDEHNTSGNRCVFHQLSTAHIRIKQQSACRSGNSWKGFISIYSTGSTADFKT